ncbi:cellular nucleic acid-binding protein, partial [Trifolium medium]|nr:cellular nucleic acid-binding protein [Trifolium medium]
VEAEEDKCVKFESGLRPDIKLLIGFSEIRDFPTLMTKSRICDEDCKAKTNYYKALNDRKGRVKIVANPMTTEERVTEVVKGSRRMDCAISVGRGVIC